MRMRCRALTQLQQRPKGRRPWQTVTLDNKSISSALQDDLLKYRRYCNALEQQNARLRELIRAFKNASEMDPFLAAHFDQRANHFAERINARLARVTALQRDSNLSSVPEFPDDDVTGKSQLLDVHERLVRRALRQERDTVVARLQLQIFHDHRTRQDLHRLIEDVKRGKSVNAERPRERKRVIKHLREAIEYEKGRIAVLQSPGYDLDAAAITIQRVWRGCLARRAREDEIVCNSSGDEADDEDSDHLFDRTEVREAEPDAPAPAGEM